jgi:two-component system sensor kinase FixL
MPDQEARLRAIINTTVDGIIVIDGRGLIESFNPAAERLFGYSESEVMGRNVSMLMPSPFHEEHDQYLERYQTTGRAAIIGTGRQVRGKRKDGSEFPLHLSVGEMFIDGERKFTGVLHDLTKRVALEDQLREQTALAKLGEMAAVLAHEVKNPLAGIRGVVQVIGGRLPQDSTDAQMMKEIVARIDSLDGLMKDLLLFARPPKPKREPTRIDSLVRTTAELLQRDQSLTGVKVDIKGSAKPIAVDPEMMKMVFQNLLINGAHAMESVGTIRVDIATAGEQCTIAVSDAGPGIPPDVREKIFAPFFTTKARGTGLGLPTAKRFIEAHHGQIVVECPPSGGTTVTVCLPMS